MVGTGDGLGISLTVEEAVGLIVGTGVLIAAGVLIGNTVRVGVTVLVVIGVVGVEDLPTKRMLAQQHTIMATSTDSTIKIKRCFVVITIPFYLL